MSNKGRIVTLVVKIEDEYPKWIMDSHLFPEYHHGIRVIGIAEGNVIRDAEDLQNQLGELEERLEDVQYEAMGDDT